VARVPYVAPRIVSAYEAGRTIAPALARARRASSQDAQRAVAERAVIRLLSDRSFERRTGAVSGAA
jgi:DNA topoisomerase-1